MIWARKYIKIIIFIFKKIIFDTTILKQYKIYKKFNFS
jgi:hypothetical protein